MTGLSVIAPCLCLSGSFGWRAVGYLSDPVLFHDHIEWCFGYASAGVYSLLGDKPTDSRKVSDPDGAILGSAARSPDRKIATHPDTHRLVFSPKPVTAYHIAGERDLVPAANVTVTGLLRLLVKEEAAHPQARTANRSALNHIIQKPQETIAEGYEQSDVFRASVVNRNLALTPPKRCTFGSTFRRLISRISRGTLARC